MSVIIGNHLFELDSLEFEERQKRVLHLMARALNRRNAIAFVGSGLVIPYGYPSWTDFTSQLLRRAVQQAKKDGVHENILNVAVASDSSDDSTDAKARALTQCELLLKDRLHVEAANCIKESREARLAGMKAKGEVPSDANLRALVRLLGFRRFVTTNYDTTVEDYLRKLPSHVAEPADDAPGRLSLVAHTERAHEVIQFAAANTPPMGVLHLHGCLDDPSTMIVTESDYQRVYARDTPETRTYREALDVLFAGNAIFFFGLGMDEPDLLQSLRRYTSTRTPAYEHRPVFAILPTLGKKEVELAARWATLNRRYGLVSYFYTTQTTTPTELEFQSAAQSIKAAWGGWWNDWRRKPFCRRVVSTEGPLLTVNTVPTDIFAPSADLDAVVSRALGSRLVLVLGRPGSGKGSLAVHLGNDTRVAQRFPRRVVMTTHFATEFFSAIEAAAKHFDSTASSGDCLDRLEAALLRPAAPQLFVLSGLERLLTHAPAKALGMLGSWSASQGRRLLSRPPLPLGVAASGEAQRLLAILERVAATETFRGCIVLCSSTVPLQLLDGLASHNEDVVVLRGEDPGNDPAAPSDPRALVARALRGHRYALHVLDHLQRSGQPEAQWDEIRTRISPHPVPQRAEVAIDAAINMVLGTCAEPELSYKALRVVALSATPVSAGALVALLDGAVDQSLAAKILDKWREHRLLLPAAAPGSYTAHTVVRALILRRLDAQPEVHGEPRRLGVIDWTAEGAISHALTSSMHREMAGAVDRVLGKSGSLAAEDRVAAAFGIIRTCWSTSDLARLHTVPTGDQYPYAGVPHYPSYQRRIFQALRLLRDAGTWDWNEDSTRANAALQRDEIAWLYTEAALAAFAQGATQDSYSLFLMAKHMSDGAEQEQRGHRWCQGEINLAVVQIERGRLGRARQHLENAYTVARELSDRDAEARVRLYLALLFHLAGDSEQAELLYQRAHARMRRLGNRRGISIVCRHLADLRRHKGQFPAAENLIRESIAAAEGGHHLDVAWYARVAHANLALARGDRQPHEAIEPALTFAKQMGTPRLEADVYKVQAQIALQNGETELAMRLSSRALAIANALGMQLRVISAIGLLGKIAGLRGDAAAADTLLQSSIRMGRRSGYLLQVEASTRDLLNVRASRRGPGPLI